MPDNDQSPWTMMGMNAAGSAAEQATGGLLGMLFAKENDRRQLAQQEKLQNLSIKGSKEMTDYQKMKELEMWKATSYPAQMEMLKQAGLNPGLMYGMSGGGGATTGGGTGHAGLGNAPSGGGEALGLGLQMANIGLLKAQRENIEMDTKLKESEIPTAGQGIEESKARIGEIGQRIQESIARIGKIGQELKNLQAQEKLTGLESSLKELNVKYEAATQADRQQLLKTSVAHAAEALAIIENDRDISDATKKDKINQVKADLFLTLAQTALTRSQKTLTDKQAITEVARNEQIAAQITQGARALDIQKLRAEVDAQRRYDDSTQQGDPIGELLEKLGFLIPIPGVGKKPGEIGGFHKRNK